MDGDTLGALLDRRVAADGEEGDAGNVLYAPGDPERRYDAVRLRTDARKTGNFLRQLGVGSGRMVAIVDHPTPETVLALFGAALLGAPTRIVSPDASASESSEIDARVLVGPVDAIDAVPVNAAKHVAYGARPDDPEVAYFERDVWSENPTFPPTAIDERSPALVSSRGDRSHRELLAAVEPIVERWGLDGGIEIAVRAPLSDPRTVVAGVLAPLASGGVIVFPDAGSTGDVAVVTAGGAGDVPESTHVDVADVPLGGA